MKSNFLKKSFVMLFIFFVQGFFLFAFYINESLIFNFKAPYLTKVYLPSYALSLTKFRSETNNYLASTISAFDSRNASSTETILANDDHAKSIPVLLYHGITENSDSESMSIDNFRDQMFLIKKSGWQTISLEDFHAFMRAGKQVPDKSFLLTFDDGRKDSYYPVDPILKALDYSAVMFVITGRSLDKKRQTSPFHLSEKELGRMVKSDRWEIEAHTYKGHDMYTIASDGRKGHFYSNKLWLDDRDRLETEEEFTNRIKFDFANAKQDIERELGGKVTSFAFPFGDFGQNTVNFPEAEQIVLGMAKTFYSMAFYQVWPGKGHSFNYSIKDSPEDSFLMKRIDVKSDWSAEALLTLLDAGREKSLPYSEDFEKYSGWIKTWGGLTIGNNSMILGATDLNNGGAVFLDGSRLWGNYVFRADVRFEIGQTYSIIAGYRDNSNYVFCTFAASGIKLEQIVEGKRGILNEFKGEFHFLKKERNIGIGFAGRDASCYLGRERIIDTFAVDERLNGGGIGFKTWDPQTNNSELIIKGVSVEEI